MRLTFVILSVFFDNHWIDCIPPPMLQPPSCDWTVVFHFDMYNVSSSQKKKILSCASSGILMTVLLVHLVLVGSIDISFDSNRTLF